MDTFDEFGNYLGDRAASPSSSISSDFEENENFNEIPKQNTLALPSPYPSASTIFGMDVEVFVQDHDVLPTLSSSRPFVKSKVVRKKNEKWVEEEDFTFLLRSNPEFIRNIALVGALHSGKSTLHELLHNTPLSAGKKRDMHISAKTKPFSSARAGFSRKHFFVQSVDTPGHGNFMDEVECGLEICDGVVLVVDVVEGVVPATRRVIEAMKRFHLLEEGTTVLCVSKMDRLVHELKMKPEDAYRKVAWVVYSVEQAISDCLGREFTFDLGKEQVVFASALHGWCVSLTAMARLALLPAPGGASNGNGEDANGDANGDAIGDANGDATNDDAEPTILTSFGKPQTTPPPAIESLDKLVAWLWGDAFYDPTTREFSTTKTPANKRTFEHFVLGPIYKIYSHVLGGEAKDLQGFLDSAPGLGKFRLPQRERTQNALPLLKSVIKRILPSSACLVDAVVRNVESPIQAARSRLEATWSGNIDYKQGLGKKNSLSHALQTCDPNGPLVIHCVKLFSPEEDEELDQGESTDAYAGDATFRVFGRVYSGTVRENEQVLLKAPVDVRRSGFVDVEEEEGEIRNEDGENDAIMLDETFARPTIKAIRLSGSQKVKSAGPGTWVLLSGVDHAVTKSCTIVCAESKSMEVSIPAFLTLKTLKGASKSICKLAIEPLIPSELPKMLAGLRAVQRSYPSCDVVVEESGEHVLFGRGELYLDCIMRDLRERYARGVEIKVCDPFVALRETVTQTSSSLSVTETLNRKSTFSLVAAPMEEKLALDNESGRIESKRPLLLPLLNTDNNRDRWFEKLLKKEYGYDVLAARSLWAFGPSARGTNAFVDDSLLEDKESSLFPVKDSIVEGFRWACRAGPLCDEPLRSVKIKLLDASLAPVAAHRSAGQIIPAIRKAAHASVLVAQPALLEPVFAFEGLMTETRYMKLIRDYLTARRGAVTSTKPVPGTPFTQVFGHVPALDAYGLETEIRLRSRGAVFFELTFDRWQIVPGDPLDECLSFRPLEPSPPDYLARELVVKLRRRKGLSESLNVVKVVNEQILRELAEEAGQRSIPLGYVRQSKTHHRRQKVKV